MSNNKSRYIFLMALCLITLASCKKFLDEKSNSSLLTPQSLSELQALLDDADRMNIQRTPSTGETFADDYFLVNQNLGYLSNWNFDIYKRIPNDNYSFPNDWSLAYNPIYTANYCLEQLTNVASTNTNVAQWNNIKGSALFYRSYYFLQLLWTFSKAYDDNTSPGDLGIPLRQTSDFNQPSSRASVKASYEQVISDAKESISYLPLTALNPFRPSQIAAYGLLARTYLSMRKYDSAYKYSDLYLLNRNVLINFNGDPDINGLASSQPFKPANKETIFYTEMNVQSTAINNSISNVDTNLVALYQPNDLRSTAFFDTNNGYLFFKGAYSYQFGDNFTGIATDEIYLVRAECLARRGDINLALADLNKLLSNRYDLTFSPITSSNANAVITRILQERRKELLFRGLRLPDIKRLNKESASITLTRVVNGQAFIVPPNDNRYALPIPRDIIEQSGMAQNPL